MLNGDGNENGKKRCNWPKKDILCTCCTLFCTFLCRYCCNVKLTSSTSYGENVVCGHKKICCLYCWSLFFFLFFFRCPLLPCIILFFQRNSSPLLIGWHVFYIGITLVRADERTGVRSRDCKSLANFRVCMDNQIFLLMVLRYSR